MKENLITLLQTIINKIKGLQMTAPVPQEEYVEYLEDMIAVVNDADLDVPNELPAITAADNGKVLTVNSGVWGAQEPIGKKFIVTLTPTALDYSGTMDKTVAEISAAYEAGREIWANISAQGKNLYIPLTMASTNGEDQYPSFDFCAHDISDGLMILAFTAYTNDGTKQTYGTAIYPLDNASGVLVVTDTNGTLDKTWQEIHDAMLSVLRQEGESLFYLISTFEEDSTFGVAYSSIVDNATAIYTASSASGYPVRINE